MRKFKKKTGCKKNPVLCKHRIKNRTVELEGINAIYRNQKAKIIINNELSEMFIISKGTRQGCPLSPLLFITILEILLKVIREESEIKGIRLGSRSYQLKAFADDLIIMTENPTESIIETLVKLNKFGQVSGLKLNKDKIKLLVKNMAEQERLELEKMTG